MTTVNWGATLVRYGTHICYSALPTADLSLRKLAAIEALSRYNEATADMLGAITLDNPNLWRNSFEAVSNTRATANPGPSLKAAPRSL